MKARCWSGRSAALGSGNHEQRRDSLQSLEAQPTRSAYPPNGAGTPAVEPGHLRDVAHQEALGDVGRSQAAGDAATESPGRSGDSEVREISAHPGSVVLC